MSTIIQGGCLCGQVRYQVEKIKYICYCHCDNCRKSAGAPTQVWGGVDQEEFQIIQGQTKTYASSQEALRSFCPNCGSQLFFHREGDKNLYITIANLDTPEDFPPTYHYWSSGKLDWLDILDDLPKYDKNFQ